MKEYPKMLGIRREDVCLNQPCIMMDKLDGSSLRFEWNHKSGWYKFGTRRRLFDANDPEYGCAIEIFQNKYADGVLQVMKNKYPKIQAFIAYGEFFGPHSFAGKHDATFLEVETNDPKDIVLFDINIHKRGFIPPFQFVNDFSHLHIPTILYTGNLTLDLIQAVREGKYPVKEGVVVKGGETVHEIWMRKIKTLTYLQALKDKFGTGWQDFWE
jgi:hypothetical protein